MQLKQIRRLEALEDTIAKLTGKQETVTIHVVAEVSANGSSIHDYDEDGKDICEKIVVPVK